MPIVSTTKMTARQFLQLGEDPPGVRLELVNGEIAVHRNPFPRHSRAVSRLIYVIDNHVEERGLGAVLVHCDTVLGEYDVRRPDIMFFTSAREHFILPDKAINHAPDLCIEVLNNDTDRLDRVDKFKQYANAHVAYYWIVDPGKCSVEAYELRERSYRLIGVGSHDDMVSFAPFTDLKFSLSPLWWPTSKNSKR
jgi:Uma2 family endonuclease